MFLDELPEDRYARELREQSDAITKQPLDLLFESPWSVSALWASFLAKKEKNSAEQITTAHHNAVEFALQYLNKEWASNQQGPQHLFSNGLGIEQIFHYAGRRDTGDPNLHTHTLIESSVTVREVQTPIRVDTQLIKDIAVAAGSLYERFVMEQLTKGFGVEVKRDQQGNLQIIGVDERMRQALPDIYCTIGYLQHAAI